MGDYTRLDHRKGQKELAEFPALDVPRCEEQANALFKPYLFFKNGEGTRELSCSACRKFGTFDVPARTETPELAAALYGRHNTRAKCPWCGALCELKERRYIQQGLSLLEYHAVVFLDERDGELFAQAFWTKKEHWQGMSAKELTAAPVFKQTAAYRFRLGHATMYYEGYSGMHKREVTGNFGKQHWLQEPFSTNSWHPTGLKYLVYHVYNWEALERSELRYCQYGSFHKDQKGYTDENLHGDFIKYLTAYTSYPRPMEMLMKIGHEELIKDLLYKRVKNVRVIDWKQEDIRKALGLSGQEVKAWMDAKSKAYDIGYYKQLKKKGVKVGFEELTDLYRAIPCRYTEALQNTFNWEDEDETEQPVTIPELTIQYGSRELVPVSTSAGVLLINPVYFKPLQDIRNGLEFFERTTPDGGLTYLVAKSGWVLRAVILPLRADAYPGLAETLERVAQGLAQAAQSKASRSGAAPDGMQFEIDPETGEVLED